MEVVIDQTTRERLGGRVTVEALPEVKLKGFSDSVRPFKVLALEAPALPTAPTNAPSAPKELVT
jgi:class 3 adenylate cyclase